MVNLQIIGFFIFLNIVSITFAANTERSFVNSGRYYPQHQDPYYNSRDYYNNYYNNYNRDYYNNRQYYDSYYKNYNPNVVPAQARTVENDVRTPDNGAYSYSYDTENGIHADERGTPVQIRGDVQKEIVQGSYSFVTPEGLHILVRYTADENGFHPVITYSGGNAAQFERLAQPADVVVTNANGKR